MSAEGKKLLWISISVCAFVVVVFAVGIFLLSPKKGGAQAPAAIGNSAPPKAQDPQDFLSTPPPVPSLEQPRNQDGNMVIVYGDKPNLPAATSTTVPTTGTTTVPATEAPPATGTIASPGVAPLPAPVIAPAAAQSADQARAAAAPAVAVAPVKAPRVSVPAAKKILARPASAKVQEFWIQAASFTSRGRADDLKQALADKGIAALIIVKDISGKSWYRVRVGPYSAQAEAGDWLKRLKDLPACSEAYVSKLTATKVQP